MLPKFLEPRVSEVRFWPEFQIIIVKPLDIGGLELDCNSSNSFSLVPICHVIPVSPAVAGETHKQKQACQLRAKLPQGNKSCWFETPRCKVATAGLTKTLYSLPEVTVTYQPVRSRKQDNKMTEYLEFRCQKSNNLTLNYRQKASIFNGILQISKIHTLSFTILPCVIFL